MPCSIISHRWPSIAWSVHLVTRVWSRCSAGVVCPCLRISWPTRSTVAVSLSKVYLPTIVSGRVIWHLGYTKAASAAAFAQSYGEFQRAAFQHEPTYRVRGILTDGFDSTTKSMRALFPGARLGNRLRHAINKLPAKLTAITSPVRQALRTQFHTLLHRARQRKGLRVFALGQRLRLCFPKIQIGQI